MTPFTIATNSIKYLGVTLTKHVKDLYDKNFKTLKKEIEKKTSKNGKTWEIFPFSEVFFHFPSSES